MKNILLTIAIFTSSILFAQNSIKYQAISTFSIERINGKKGFTKPKKVDTQIVIDFDNKKIILSEKELSYKILEIEPSNSGENFSIINYKCIDENKKECDVSVLKFSNPNQNGVLQQLFISYSNIEYVYDMNVME